MHGIRLDVVPGVTLWRGALDREAQRELLADVCARGERASFYRPRMPVSGKPFSVEMTNFGPLGWVSDEKGYRYSQTHPQTGRPWPEIPPLLLALWTDAPVLSVSVGDAALFRIGGTTRREPTKSLRLESGDALTFGGPARLAFHGIDRVLEGTSDLVPGGGRINLTLRRVTPPKKQDARPGG